MTYPKQAVNTAFSLLPVAMDTRHARIQHAAIGFQESKYKSRRQLLSRGGALVPEGPAVSYWQFENGRLAGIEGVLTHRATAALAKSVCAFCNVEPERMAVWRRMQDDDVLGAAFARLLMYTDPRPVPTNEVDGWAMYLRTWRPGKPHPGTWAASYAAAVSAVSA